VCKKLVYRKYKEEGLTLRHKARRTRRAALHRRERFRPTAPNQVWSLDFVADQLADGRRFRALTIMGVFTREGLAIEVGQKLKGEDVVSTLNEIRQQRGLPRFLYYDNGSEFTSQIMDLWAYHNQVQIDFSRPGKPKDNAHVESFFSSLSWLRSVIHLSPIASAIVLTNPGFASSSQRRGVVRLRIVAWTSKPFGHSWVW
jgi:putative transposase